MLALHILKKELDFDLIERIDELCIEMMDRNRHPAKLILGPVLYDRLLRQHMSANRYTHEQLLHPHANGIRITRYASTAGYLDVTISKNAYELRVEE